MTDKETLKHTIRKTLGHISISMLIIFGIFMCTIKGNAQTTAGIPFNNIISGRNNASVYYRFGGNNFVGMFFWSGSTSYTSGENIYLSGSTTPISCKSKLNGMYYNNMRGRRLWPLDTGNLQTLTVQDNGYSAMSISGGLFTDCTGTNINTNDIFGQVSHTRGGINYAITAGITYNFTGNSITYPSVLSGTFRLITGNTQGFIYDTYGGIGEVGPITISGTTVGISNGIVSSQCNSFQMTQSSGSNITLTCSGTNVSQYILNIFSNTSGLPLVNQSIVAGASAYSWNLSNLATGNYIATCTTNVGSTSCTQVAITISNNGSTSVIGGTGISIASGLEFSSSIPTIRSAKLRKLYTSEVFHVKGITGSSTVTISNGYLYINGTGAGQTGSITSSDKLSIEMMSSEEYNTNVSSEITVAGITGTFTIITMDPDSEVCQLSKSEKIQIKDLFNSIKSGYVNNETKRNKMIYTMRSMIRDIQDFDYSCSLQYMQDLADDEIDADDETHIAPNCKEYTISYNKTKGAYTSTNFKKIQYFASREAVVRFIDALNPGDCHINTYSNTESYENEDESRHIAPNGKVYQIDEGSGYYYSSTMAKKKNFDDRDVLIRYIDINNPEIAVWNHEVDTDFDPIVYAAPNNKEYTIYKTDQGYMSYRLIKVKYFDSLEEIQAYIYKNNK